MQQQQEGLQWLVRLLAVQWLVVQQLVVLLLKQMDLSNSRERTALSSAAQWALMVSFATRRATQPLVLMVSLCLQHLLLLQLRQLQAGVQQVRQQQEEGVRLPSLLLLMVLCRFRMPVGTWSRDLWVQTA